MLTALISLLFSFAVANLNRRTNDNDDNACLVDAPCSSTASEDCSSYLATTIDAAQSTPCWTATSHVTATSTATDGYYNLVQRQAGNASSSVPYYATRPIPTYANACGGCEGYAAACSYILGSIPIVSVTPDPANETATTITKTRTSFATVSLNTTAVFNNSPTNTPLPPPVFAACYVGNSTNQTSIVLVDLETNATHCGSCNNACPGGASGNCTGGVCTSTSPEACPSGNAGTCGSYTSCGQGGQLDSCMCYMTAEAGGSVCAADLECSGLKDCNTSEDCGGGRFCAVGTCCGGRGGVCMEAACGNPSERLMRLARISRDGKAKRRRVRTTAREAVL